MVSKVGILTWPYTIPDNDVAVCVSIDCEPFSKGRPRFGRRPNGSVVTYNTRKTTDYEQMISAFLRTNLKGELADPHSFFGLRCVFYRSTKQRIDCDNLIKAISDAANMVVWADDFQVAEIMSRSYLGCDKPSVDILIYRVHDIREHVTCKKCGIPIKSFKSYKRKYCSTACHRLDMRVDKECPVCGVTYQVLKCHAERGKVIFCSPVCRSVHAKMSGPLKKLTNKLGKCEICGEAMPVLSLVRGKRVQDE
jgi:Holliday junction resolvase RusA-like endonuclease